MVCCNPGGNYLLTTKPQGHQSLALIKQEQQQQQCYAQNSIIHWNEIIVC